MRYLFYTVVVIVIALAGYFIGVRITEKKMEQTVISNYGYVKEIAQLASLEVNGITHIHRSNVETDNPGFAALLKKRLLEKTVDLSIPYTAKYGIDMKDSNFRIVRQDSVVAVYLPHPKLLSFELRLDRMLAHNKTGWFIEADEELYTRAQQKLYQESRQQLTNNPAYLQQSQEKISKLMKGYFTSVGLRAVCYFDEASVEIKRD